MDAMYVNTTEAARRITIPALDAVLLGPASACGGSLTVMHQVLPPGASTPAHRHRDEDQISIMIDGTLGFWVEGEEELELGAGGFIFRPRGRLHALWNASDEPATMLEITTPAESFERWMLALSDLNDAGGASADEVRALAATFGISFAGPGDPPDPSRNRTPGQRDAF